MICTGKQNEQITQVEGKYIIDSKKQTKNINKRHYTLHVINNIGPSYHQITVYCYTSV